MESAKAGVQLKDRKAKDVGFAMVFLAAFVAHLGIGMLFATDAKLQILLPNGVVNGKSSAVGCDDPGIHCRWVSDDCPFGQAKLKYGETGLFGDCVNPCHEGYLYKTNSSACIAKSALDDAVEQCSGLHRRRLSALENPEEDRSSLSVDELLADSTALVGTWIGVAFFLAAGWGLALQHSPHFMVWGTVALAFLALLALTVWGIVEELYAIVVVADATATTTDTTVCLGRTREYRTVCYPQGTHRGKISRR